jgi:hypothetical protein
MSDTSDDIGQEKQFISRTESTATYFVGVTRSDAIVRCAFPSHRSISSKPEGLEWTPIERVAKPCRRRTL